MLKFFYFFGKNELEKVHDLEKVQHELELEKGKILKYNIFLSVR